MRAHEALSRLAKARASADAEEGRWLLAALRSAVHVHLGFGGFGEYVERLFGYSRRFTREKLRVAEALEELPGLASALEEGVLNWSAVRELTRVVVPETEREWLEVAKGKTARQLEELVAGKAPGATPESPCDESARRHVLRFEVEGETFAVFRQAMGELRRRAGSVLEDDALLLEMARHVLGASRDEGRSAYQLALTVCAECGAGRQDAGADVVVVAPEVVEMALCDAQHLGRVDEHAFAADHAQHLGREDEHAFAAGHAHDSGRVDEQAFATGDARQLERAAAQPLGTSDAQPLASDTQPLGETVQPANDAGPTHLGRERHEPHSARAHRATQAAPTHTGRPGHGAHPAHRATQDVPPAVRRAVLRRDHGRCRVPGCRNATFLEVHHIVPRAEGGGHHAGNLLTVCGAHHRALHRGELAVEGDTAASSSFRHAGRLLLWLCRQPQDPRFDEQALLGLARPRIFGRPRCARCSGSYGRARGCKGRQFRTGCARRCNG